MRADNASIFSELCYDIAHQAQAPNDSHDGVQLEIKLQQPVYAWLPLRPYGLKFIIHADWEVRALLQPWHIEASSLQGWECEKL